MLKEPKQTYWLGNKPIEIGFILLPSILSCAFILLNVDYFEKQAEVSQYWWLVLVLGLDVSHVYSTLYRTYFDKESFNNNRDLFVYTPIICLVVSILLYSIHPLAFWRVLAYLAVFHFMRQQYGIMRLYEKKEINNNFTKRLNTITIYSAVLYPIFFWHIEPNRQFSWFVDGDFWAIQMPFLKVIIGYLYSIILALFSGNTLYLLIFKKHFNVPKNIWIIGTILSWYLGIVEFNADLIFTALNIISHGIPYIALVWIYKKKETIQNSLNGSLNWINKWYGIYIFLLLLLVFAFVEEGLWDALVWREHGQFFGNFMHLPQIKNSIVLGIIIPILSLPQTTHYVLDAFIWKVKSKEKGLG